MRKLIAGPTVFICDECVELSNDIIEDDEILRLFAADDEQMNRSHSTEQLMSAVERAKKHVGRWRRTLQQVKRKLSARHGEVFPEGDVLNSPGFAYLKDKTRDDLLAIQQHHERALKRYEDVQHIAAAKIGERER